LPPDDPSHMPFSTKAGRFQRIACRHRLNS